MIRDPGALIKETVRLWSDRHVEGAIRVEVQRPVCYDQTDIILHTSNYAKHSISGLAIARCDGTQELWRLIEAYLRQDMMNLADQLEKVAAGIRSGL